MGPDQVTLPEGFEVQNPAGTSLPDGFEVQKSQASGMAALIADPRFGPIEAGMNLVTGIGVGFPTYLVRGILGIGEEGRGPEPTPPATLGAQPAGFSAAVRSARARRADREAEVAAIEAMGRPGRRTLAEQASAAVTYAPRGEAAQELLAPLAKLNDIAEKKGHEITDATGSPVLGALTESTITMAPAILLPMLRAGVKGVTAGTFRNAATVIDGKPAVSGEPSSTEAKLQKIYVETGHQPAQVIKAALEDTNTMADLVADNRDIPPALLEKGEPPAEESPAGGKGAPDAEEPADVALQPPAQPERPTHAGDTIEMPPEESRGRRAPAEGADSLTVVRHGETQLNDQELVRGWIDVPLNDRGMEQAKEIASTLKGKGLQAIVTSDLKRAKDTASEIGRETGLPVIEDPGLRPWNVGEYSGKPNKVVAQVLEDLATNHPDKPIAGGESFNQFRDRYLGAVERISAEHPGERVALVTHHRGDRLLDAWAKLGMPADHQVHLPTFMDWESGIKTGTHMDMPAPRPRGEAVLEDQPSAFEVAARDQIAFLNREAKARGLQDADALHNEEPAEFDRLARNWRMEHEKQAHFEIPLAENLRPEQRVVEAKARTQVQSDLEGNIEAYQKLPDSMDGKILNTDVARELFPDYQENRSIHSPSVHEPASALVKELYLRKLSEPDPTGLNMVTFTAGGTGAGKTTALGFVPLASHIVEASQIVYDTNMNKATSAIAKVDLALQHGKQVNIMFVGADPVEALERALDRATRTGRTVHLDEHAKTHEGSAQVLAQMMEHYKGNDRVQFIILDNGSAGKGEVTIIDPKDAKKYLKTLDFKNLDQRLKEKLDAEHEAGNISEEVYRGTAATLPEGARGALGERGQGQSRADGKGETAPAAALKEEIGGRGPKVKPGEKFIVYRLGRKGNLTNRNGGNADAIARYIMDTEDFDSPISSKAGKVFAYEVSVDQPFGKYEGLEGARAGEQKIPGRTTRGREVTYSFPEQGYTAKLIGSRSLKELRTHLKTLGAESFDDAGSNLGAKAIRQSFAKGENFDLAKVPAAQQPQAMGEEIGRQLRAMGASDEEVSAASKSWQDALESAAERHDTTPAKLLADPAELARDRELPPEIRQALERMPHGGPASLRAQRGMVNFEAFKILGGDTPPPRTPGEAAVLERISKDAAAKRSYSWEAFYADVKDDLYPIKRLTDELRAGEALGTSEDPYKLARLTRGAYGKAEQFLEYSPFDFKTYQNVGKSMRAIIDPVKHDLDGLRAYALSKRAIELEARGIETGVPLDAAKQVVAEGERYAQVLRELHEYQDHLTAYLKDAGILSAEGVKAMREANKEYVPFFRLMDDAEGAAGAGTGLKVHQPVKRIRGSERKIIDPLESIVKNTYLYTTLAERNAVGEALVALAERTGRDDLVKEITPPARPIKVQDEEVRQFLKENGIDADKDFEEAMTIFRCGNLTLAEDEIAVFRGGKRKLYQVPEEVATAFKATDRESAGMLTRVLAIPAKLLRVGATLSPDFISRNPVRDQFSAYVLSKSGYVPILDMARGVASIAKHDADFQNWLKSGGANAAMVSLDRDYVQQELARRTGELGFADKAWNIVKNPLEPLRIASELMENATRLGEFKKAAAGDVSKEALLSAGYEAREVTLDFARIGARTRAMNLITAFWNANLEGVDRVVRAVKERPLQTTVAIATSITLPSVLLWMANHDDDWVDPQGNHHNRWKETPNWERDLFWIVLTKDHIYRIPKPFELGVLFGSSVERLLDAFVDAKPEAGKDLWGSLVNTMGINMVPTGAAPILGHITNWNFFTDRPLIPAAQEKLLPEYQYSSYTTQTTRALGHLIGTIPGMHDKSMASPQVIDNYIRSWTGTLGNYALQIADAALRKTGVLPDPVRPAKSLEDMPVLRGFMVRFPSSSAQSIQDFYDAYEKSKKVTDTIKYLASQGDPKAALQEMRLDQEQMVRIESIHQALSKAQQVLQLIDKNPNFDENQKRQLIDTTYYQMILMARAGDQALIQVKGTLKRAAPAQQAVGAPPEGFQVAH